MSARTPTRDEAKALVRTYIENQNLVHHCTAVGSVMRYLARRHGENEEMWEVIGLVHDLDWERFPDQHCMKTRAILEDLEWPVEYIRAVLSHGWGICTDVEPETLLEKTLYAVDEMTGFVTACALVRPSKSVLDLKVSSVKKKWKQKGFAAGVDRDVIIRGAAMLERDLDDLTEDVISGMREVAREIGL